MCSNVFHSEVKAFVVNSFIEMVMDAQCCFVKYTNKSEDYRYFALNSRTPFPFPAHTRAVASVAYPAVLMFKTNGLMHCILDNFPVLLLMYVAQ